MLLSDTISQIAFDNNGNAAAVWCQFDGTGIIFTLTALNKAARSTD